MLPRFCAVTRFSTRYTRLGVWRYNSTIPKDKNESPTEVMETKEGELKGKQGKEDEDSFEITPAEAKFKNAIADMKSMKAQVKQAGGGKYAIDYPEVSAKQIALDNTLRSEANKELERLDNVLKRFDDDESVQHEIGTLERMYYWFSSAECTTFVILCAIFYFSCIAFRYSQEFYYFNDQFEEKEQEMIHKIRDLERALSHVRGRSLLKE